MAFVSSQHSGLFSPMALQNLGNISEAGGMFFSPRGREARSDAADPLNWIRDDGNIDPRAPLAAKRELQRLIDNNMLWVDNGGRFIISQGSPGEGYQQFTGGTPLRNLWPGQQGTPDRQGVPQQTLESQFFNSQLPQQYPGQGIAQNNLLEGLLGNMPAMQGAPPEPQIAPQPQMSAQPPQMAAPQTPQSMMQNPILSHLLQQALMGQQQHGGGGGLPPTQIQHFEDGGKVKNKKSAISDFLELLGIERGEVPIVAHEGEYVVNKDAVKAVGKDVLDKINNLPHYQTGGFIPGQLMQPSRNPSTANQVNTVVQQQPESEIDPRILEAAMQYEAARQAGQIEGPTLQNVQETVHNRVDTAAEDAYNMLRRHHWSGEGDYHIPFGPDGNPRTPEDARRRAQSLGIPYERLQRFDDIVRELAGNVNIWEAPHTVMEDALRQIEHGEMERFRGEFPFGSAGVHGGMALYGPETGPPGPYDNFEAQTLLHENQRPPAAPTPTPTPPPTPPDNVPEPPREEEPQAPTRRDIDMSAPPREDRRMNLFETPTIEGEQSKPAYQRRGEVPDVDWRAVENMSPFEAAEYLRVVAQLQGTRRFSDARDGVNHHNEVFQELLGQYGQITGVDAQRLANEFERHTAPDRARQIELETRWQEFATDANAEQMNHQLDALRAMSPFLSDMARIDFETADESLQQLRLQRLAIEHDMANRNDLLLNADFGDIISAINTGALAEDRIFSPYADLADIAMREAERIDTNEAWTNAAEARMLRDMLYNPNMLHAPTEELIEIYGSGRGFSGRRRPSVTEDMVARNRALSTQLRERSAAIHQVINTMTGGQAQTNEFERLMQEMSGGGE